MRHLRLFGMALLSIMALGVALSASASAAVLPDIHLLPEGKSDSMKGTAGKAGSKETAAFLEAEVGKKISAEEVEILLTLEGLSSLGPADIHFVGVSLKAGEPCETAGDSEGVVLVKGEWHLVFVSLKPLVAAFLFLPEEVVLKCLKEMKETTKIKVKGHLLAQLEATDMEMTTKFGIKSPKCVNKGKQDLTKYENDEGKIVEKALLLANAGVGFENACEQVEIELIPFTAEPDIEFLI